MNRTISKLLYVFYDLCDERKILKALFLLILCWRIVEEELIDCFPIEWNLLLQFFVLSVKLKWSPRVLLQSKESSLFSVTLQTVDCWKKTSISLPSSRQVRASIIIFKYYIRYFSSIVKIYKHYAILIGTFETTYKFFIAVISGRSTHNRRKGVYVNKGYNFF